MVELTFIQFADLKPVRIFSGVVVISDIYWVWNDLRARRKLAKAGKLAIAGMRAVRNIYDMEK